jgi:sialic acid synthase SpsE
LSADPADLRRLAGVVHDFDDMRGNGEKTPCEAEQQMAVAARRSIVAARDLPAGTVLAMTDFDFVRPRNGLPPSSAGKLAGRTLRVSLKAHDVIQETHLS